MSHKDVNSALKDIVPCCHMEWPNDTAPSVPFACYYLDYGYPYAADDSQIATKRKWIVELYEKRRDKALEERVEASLKASFGVIRRDENYIENDNLLQVVFTFYQIEGENDG